MRLRLIGVFVCSGVLALGALGCGSSNNASPPDTGAVTPDAGSQLGPGAAFKCTSSGKDAYDTYGLSAFVAVNDSIFANVNSEITANGTTNVGDSFTKIGTGNPPSTADDAATFKGELAAFLVWAYGGPSKITYTDGKSYGGPQDMVKAHTGLNITSNQYDYFVANIVVPALTSNGVPMSDVSSCFAPVLTDANFKASIVGH